MPKGIRTPTPVGFSRIKYKGRIYFRCLHTTKYGKVTFRCNYKIRSDRFSQKCFKHIHKFAEIKDFYEQEDPTTSNFEKKIFDTIGHLHISISAACSEEFYSLLNTAFRYGQRCIGDNFDFLFPHQSRKTFTKKFVAHSNNYRNLIFEKYSKSCFASIVLDSGSIKQISYLNIVLLNTDNVPIVLKNIRFFNGKSIDYYKQINEQIAFLNEKKNHSHKFCS